MSNELIMFIFAVCVCAEMDKFTEALVRFQTDGVSSSTAITTEQQWCEQVHKKVAIATIILFGVCDIHPFRVGMALFIHVLPRRRLTNWTTLVYLGW
jgi:hypothetical protein